MIKQINPNLKIGKIKPNGTSFIISIKNLDINLKQLEYELVDALCMPGLNVVRSGEENNV